MNVFDLYAKLSLDSSGYEKGLSEAQNEAESFGSKFASAASTGFKVMGAAVTAASTAVGALAKQSVDAYGEYEQLKGGVETLFGSDAETVLKNAEKAYATAGQSMNEYMETSIQSAASLINSLEGDTTKAAELMDMSIIDMSDNVNKMGTTMEAVQNAYRGFSRGNFTMLDNLALGFAGTKQGMEELLEKAEEISGIKYDISSYADMVQAIHVVQTEMGITGTTAKEGVETITGSISNLKSAWENLVAGFGKEDSNMDELIGYVVEGASNVINNMLPIIEKAIAGIGTFVEKAAPIVAEELPKLIESALPALINAASSLIKGLVNALPSILSMLVDMLPDIIDTVLDLLFDIIDAILDALPQIISALAKAIPKIIKTIVTKVMENLPTIIQGLVDLVLAIVDALPTIIVGLIEALPDIIDAVITGILESLPILIEGLIQLVLAIVEHLPEIIEALIEAIPMIIEKVGTAIIDNFFPILEAVATGLLQIFDAIAEWIGGLITQLGDWLAGIFQAVADWFSGLISDIGNWLKDIVTAIGDWFGNLIHNIGDWLKDVWNGIKEFFSHAWELGVDLVRGIWEGIKNAASEFWNNIVGWLGDVWNGIKDFFGIHSPSTEMAWIGEMMVKGFSKGLEQNGRLAVDAMKSLNEDVQNAFDPQMDVSSYADMASYYATGLDDYGGFGDSDYVGEEVVVSRTNDDEAGRNITVILELDKVQLGRAVYQMNREETQRIGVRLAGAV